MPVSTRHKDKGSSSSGGGKAHTMPPPQPEPGMTKEQMMAPAPILIPGRLRDEKAAGARFNNIIHFGGQRAKDLTKDVKGQTQELLQHLDQLLSENMTDKTKIVNCHVFVKDKASFNDM
jgi:enamine deaminase RidA (YjgF/YER057c/UK114 family)